jgi:hypothetical protein
MSAVCAAVSGVRVRASGGLAAVIGLASGHDIMVPSSAFFELDGATGRVGRIGYCAFERKPIMSITIPRHVQILCSFSFSDCYSLSSVTFETDSELRWIGSYAFSYCFFKSVTIPRRVRALCSACFLYCVSLSSVSFEKESELTRIDSAAFSHSALRSITIPRIVEVLDGSAFLGVSSISLSIDPNNFHFVVRSHFVFDASHTRLIRYFGQESNVIIPYYVVVLCSSCFSHFHSLSSISFGRNSNLARIEADAFSYSSLKSIAIPRNVQILCSSCFLCCRSLSSISFETDSSLTQIESEAFSHSLLGSITIPRHVQVLSSSCFSYCKSLSSIWFESESELTVIESNAFSHYGLKSITIPRNVEFLDSSAFLGVSEISISIEPGNLHLAVRSDFVLDSSGARLIRYFGDESDVIVPFYVETLSLSCFSYCHSLSSVSFENDSKLRRIESDAFSHSTLKSIIISQNVEFIDGSAFSTIAALLISIDTDNPHFGYRGECHSRVVKYQIDSVFWPGVKCDDPFQC